MTLTAKAGQSIESRSNDDHVRQITDRTIHHDAQCT